MRFQGKRGQLTIFIILGILIVSALILIFIIRQDKGSSVVSPKEDPKGYIEYCIGQEVEKVLSRLYADGLSLDPALVTRFGSKNASVLCYTENDNELCSITHPLLIHEAERDMVRALEISLPKCFDILRDQFKDSYRDNGVLSVEATINPRTVEISLTKKISIDRGDFVMDLEKFQASISSNIYTFFTITNQILSQEVLCDCPNELCNADLLRLNMAYQDFEIIKDIPGKGRESFTIKERLTGKETVFLIRNCVLNYNV